MPINVGSLLKDISKPIDQISVKLNLNPQDSYQAARSFASNREISERSFKFVQKMKKDNPDHFERQDHKSNFTDDISPSKSLVVSYNF